MSLSAVNLEICPAHLSPEESSVASLSATPSTHALTQNMKRGEEAAFKLFYDLYFSRLSRYLLVISSGNEDLAREALQATLLRVARYIKVFQEEKAFWDWQALLARSAFRDESRKRRRYFSFLERFLWQTETCEPVSLDPDQALKNLLEHEIKMLPADEQRLIEQKYFDGQPIRQLAEERQTTEKAVESKLARTRKKLKQAILKRLQHEKCR